MKILGRVLGTILILQAFNFGVNILIGLERLVMGLPRGFVASLLNMFLDFVELFLSPIGLTRILLLGVGLWLVFKKYRKKEKAKREESQ